MNANHIRVFKLAMWLLLALAILLLLVLPWLTSILDFTRLPSRTLKYLRFAEFAQTKMMQCLILIWLFFVGSCFASFLDVVAWRVPRGRSINGSSKCPFCNNRLGIRDNVPVIGWVGNGGRCRHCRLPISPRYLIVEIILGLIFLALCLVEIFGGGMNLPFRDFGESKGFQNLIFDPGIEPQKWVLIRLAVYHLTLICFLFTSVLIRSEKLKIPVSIFVTGIVFGVAFPLLWPDMLLVSWQVGVQELIPLNRFSANQIITLVAGLSGGCGMGLIVHWSYSFFKFDQNEKPKVDQSSYIFEPVAALGLVGLFLGWQSAISVTLLYFVFLFLFARTAMRNNASLIILVGTFAHLLAWRFLTWIHYWPSQSSHWLVVLASIAICLILASIALQILPARQKEFPQTESNTELSSPPGSLNDN